MTIVVGYVPRAEGRAALRRAAEEARLRRTRSMVDQLHRGGPGFDEEDNVEHEQRARRGAAR